MEDASQKMSSCPLNALANLPDVQLQFEYLGKWIQLNQPISRNYKLLALCELILKGLQKSVKK